MNDSKSLSACKMLAMALIIAGLPYLVVFGLALAVGNENVTLTAMLESILISVSTFFAGMFAYKYSSLSKQSK